MRTKAACFDFLILTFDFEFLINKARGEKPRK